MQTSLLANGKELSHVAKVITKAFGKTIWNIVEAMLTMTTETEGVGTHQVPEEIYEPVWTADDIAHTEMEVVVMLEH